MHRIGEVVVDEAMAARPAAHAEDAAPGRIGELGRQSQLARVRLLGAREVDEHAVVRLGHRIAVDRFAAFECAARHRRHPHDGAAAVERHAVVAAGDVVAQDLAARQPRTAMRTIVFEAMHLAGVVAPQHQMAAEHLHAVRPAGLYLHRLRHHVPLAEHARRQAFLDLVLVRNGHDLPPLTPRSRCTPLPLVGRGRGWGSLLHGQFSQQPPPSPPLPLVGRGQTEPAGHLSNNSSKRVSRPRACRLSAV